MLLGTGSNAATYFAFHFSAETKRMHQTSRYSPDVPASLKSRTDPQYYLEQKQ
jgi:hypothetical protein